jgi:P-type Cu+ transporter
MKYALALCIALLMTTGFAHAQKAEKADKAKTTATEKAAMVCPVTGEDADPDVSYVYEGKTYYFCCKGCVAKFKKEPTKYVKASAKGKFDACNDHAEKAASDAHNEKASDADKAYQVGAGGMSEGGTINEGKDFSAQIVNKMCPVMNKAVDKKVTTVTYKDKVYGFCCKSCIKKFAANPEKYLNKDK